MRLNLRNPCFALGVVVTFLAGRAARDGRGLEAVCLGAAAVWFVLAAWAEWE